MKILFSPSEGKKPGGQPPAITEKSFLFPALYEKREEVLHRYNDYIKYASNEQLSKLFGIKDPLKSKAFKKDIFKQQIMPAIERYNGVAFTYLDYASLSKEAQDYLHKNTIIFSNLFGPVGAGDFGLPEYKLKQGEKIDGFAPEKFYKEHFSNALDDILKDKAFLDLRAGFYNKFYKPSSPYTTLKFIKNNKVVSHWAKAYRGIVLRKLAENSIETIEEFMALEIDNLTIKEIVHKGIHSEVIYTIS